MDMDVTSLQDQASKVATDAANLFEEAQKLANQATHLADMAVAGVDGSMDFLSLFTVFVLSCFVGFYVVWSVTPALHSPLMAVTNAISSVIIVGGLLAAGHMDMDFSAVMGFMAVTLASVNIFGGFIVTQRMLVMYKKKNRG
ncbi:MAG: NAD synthetase [Rhodospirillaceae bacterium TMED8]|nr:NAD synthetase [Magnetovibrio sp.]OUT50179.1 MAG: NAD synthetase [Rhodospirillaceae bacterium TMED8]|tara:strand:+ start:286 stop:711 length:426 start_codon:yes stop_codon:yes gene_type:complete